MIADSLSQEQVWYCLILELMKTAVDLGLGLFQTIGEDLSGEGSDLQSTKQLAVSGIHHRFPSSIGSLICAYPKQTSTSHIGDTRTEQCSVFGPGMTRFFGSAPVP